jgi:hypothetical protein
MESILLTQVTPVQLEQLISEAVGKKLEELKNYFAQSPSETELLSREETAEFFGKCTSTIDNWRRDGKIIRYAIGNSVFFKKSELEQAMVKLKN